MSLNEFEQLLARYHAGECTPEEEEWLAKWLSSTSIHQTSAWHELSEAERQAYVDTLYTDIIGSSETSASETSASDQDLLIKRSRIRKLAWLGGAAASICLLLTFYFTNQRNATSTVDEWTTVVTEAGQQLELNLDDGTTIWLQGGSEISYPENFKNGQRSVRLDGEAFFDVSHRSNRPFVITTGSVETEVLGTSFNIEAFSELDHKVVSLIEGKVAVRVRDQDGGQIGEAVILAPHEAAVFSNSTNVLAKSEMPVFGSTEDFKAGQIHFDDTPMEEVLFRLANAYGVEITYDEERAAQHHITGDFTVTEPVDGVFQSIARSTGAYYTRDGRSIKLIFE